MKQDSQDTAPTQHDSPLEKVFDKIISPFEEFIHKETTSGILLMICAVAALLIANSMFYGTYQSILHAPVGVTLGAWSLEKDLHHWINDGLMALFFFVVGLEIKREVIVGELSDIRQASLPIVAAIGGMVVPALAYAMFNMGSDSMRGWGIPMATDIAFAVGALVMLGARVPRGLMTFLVALAIVDDLGAVMVIALFYTEDLYLQALAVSGLCFVVLIGLNVLGVRKPLPYFLVGLIMWVAMLKSGVHATLAGVLTALAIPARPKYEPTDFSRYMRKLLDRFDNSHRPNESIMKNEQQRSILQTVQNGIHLVETPLQRLEHNMHIPVAFLIIPIFALANAGVPIELSTIGESLTHPITLGIIAGLVVGKCLGISGACWLALKLGISKLPPGITFPHIIGVSLLAGIGFTMSIFIAELAFGGAEHELLMAKTGILFASLLAGTGGVLCLLMCAKPDHDNRQHSSPD